MPLETKGAAPNQRISCFDRDSRVAVFDDNTNVSQTVVYQPWAKEKEAGYNIIVATRYHSHGPSYNNVVLSCPIG